MHAEHLIESRMSHQTNRHLDRESAASRMVEAGLFMLRVEFATAVETYVQRSGCTECGQRLRTLYSPGDVGQSDDVLAEWADEQLASGLCGDAIAEFLEAAVPLTGDCCIDDELVRERRELAAKVDEVMG